MLFPIFDFLLPIDLEACGVEGFVQTRGMARRNWGPKCEEMGPAENKY